MNSASPIRNLNQIEMIKLYLKSKSNLGYLIFVTGINTNLRISDLLQLKVSDFIEKKKIKKYINLTEKKTGKSKKTQINANIGKAVQDYIKEEHLRDDDYLFRQQRNNKPISRVYAFRLLQNAGEYCGLEEPLSPHSLRKTWGYHALKNGVSPILIMEALNHSSIKVTMRYLGILQEDLDEIYINLNL